MAAADDFDDLRELGIDCDVASDSLTQSFTKAVDHLPSLLPLDNAILLTLYSYYKQGTVGPCNSPKPMFYDFKGRSKWEAWKNLGELSQNEAKSLYIQTIQKIDPKFNINMPYESKDSWVSVSVLKNPEENLKDGEKTINDYINEENLEKIQDELPKIKNINRIDENGLGLLHWAADRGLASVLDLLLKFKVNINLQDTMGQTALHYAASCGHVECVKLLLIHEANKSILDNDGLMPVDVASDDCIKELLL